MPPENFNCPTECPRNEKKPFDAHRSRYCEDCPVGAATEKFKKNTLEKWRQRVGLVEAKKYDFEDVLSFLRNITRLEDTPKDKISVKDYELLCTYLFEKARADAVKEFNERKNEA